MGKRILLHMCCGPCGAYPLKELREKDYEVTGLFYNPNIHPLPENIKRREATIKFADLSDMRLIVIDAFDQEKWEAYDANDPKRCEMCYEVRMEETAKIAKQSGYNGFTTTLLVSPYQNHEAIKTIGKKMEKKYNIPFIYIDFRPHFREGQSTIKEMGIYKQKYCGCIHSYNKSEFKEKIKWD